MKIGDAYKGMYIADKLVLITKLEEKSWLNGNIWVIEYKTIADPDGYYIGSKTSCSIETFNNSFEPAFDKEELQELINRLEL